MEVSIISYCNLLDKFFLFEVIGLVTSLKHLHAPRHDIRDFLSVGVRA